MSWTPPERPAWVRAINAGEVVPIAEEAALPLTRDALIGEAAARQGRSGASARERAAALGWAEFEAESAIENLDRFLDAIEAEAQLTLMGRWMTRRFVLRLLEVRLQLMAYLRQDPGVQGEAISAPLFVAGAPRTGTTILHTLLAADPRHRVPEGWELLRPVPPPSPDPALFAADPRIGLSDRELVRPQTVVSGLLSIHEYGGRKPKECLSAMSFEFQSEEFTARYAVPSYERWLESVDMTPAYRMHRLVLQILQRRRQSSAWVLKSPVHLHSLPTLFELYPDARVAITHRDPLTLLASLADLIANLRWAHSDAVDVEAIAHSHLRRYRRSFDRLVDWSDSGAIPMQAVHHSRFGDFQKDPLEVVALLYERFGMEWTSRAESAMRAALEENPVGRLGEHVYTRDGFGASADALRSYFARYQQRFAVPSDD
ncbi:MAG: sulfotransferase [Deltaproteobacteria bacterium]|nr:sulfotransferase [Deltaproteobacteria bacterium]